MKRTIAVNTALALAAWGAQEPGLAGPLRMLAAALLVLVLPGAAWIGTLRVVYSPVRLAFTVVSISCLSAIAACALSAAVGPPVAPWPFLAWTAIAVNVGLALSRRPVDFELGARWGVLAAVVGTGFLITSIAGLKLVPPLEDHDMEVRGTAYGLLAEGRPYFTSNREIYLPMSHPLGFNLLVAQSLLVTGEIEETRGSYESAKRAEQAARAGVLFPWEATWRADHEAFVARPALVGTRAPSALFAGLVLALLVDITRRVTRSLGAGLAAAGLYAMAPETIVRSAYAGYFGETVFAMLVAVMLFTEHGLPRRAWWLAAAGALMAILDHKSAVLVVGIAAWFGGSALSLRSRPDPRAVALVAGFGAGTLLWWAYGFWVDAGVFVADHLRKHIAHRILLNDVRLVRDTVNHYAPSIPEVWGEFAAHTGYAVTALGLVGAVRAIVRRADERQLMLALWVVSGAVAFSLVDWRQTKHLMNGLVPMVALAVMLAAPAGRSRAWLVAALLAGAALNLVTDVRLVSNFESLTVSGASDVDGW